MTAWSHPEATQEYAAWSPPGPELDHDDRVVAGWVWRSPAAGPVSSAIVRGSQTARLRLEHAVHHLRMGDQEGLDLRAGEDQQRSAGRDHVGDGRLPEEDRHPPKKSPRASRALLAVDQDGHLAVDDHVDPEPLSPGQDPLALGIGHLVEGADDLLELRR